MFNTIDLFAGCGGLMDGFEKNSSFKTLACVEWEADQCRTLKNRLARTYHHENADNEVIRFDMQRTQELFGGFSDEIYGSHCGLDKLIGNNKIDLIVGGPPCQAYSIAGRIRDEHGMKNDYRNYLFESYVKVVNHYRPRFFVFENVQGMLSACPDGEPITDKIRKAFLEIGYHIASDLKNCVFDVADFGIPQHRRRIIIIGVNADYYNELEIPAIISNFYFRLKEKKEPWVTVREAISDLPGIYPLEKPVRHDGKNYSHEPFTSDVMENHVPRFHSIRDIGAFRLLAEDIESGRCEYTSIAKIKELYTKLTGKKSNIHKFYVLRRDEPSNTIPAHLYKDGLRHIHPDSKQARSITVREAARLQSFDDDFVFLGSTGSQYKMIGNAVPPKFAYKIAQTMSEIFKTYNHG